MTFRRDSAEGAREGRIVKGLLAGNRKAHRLERDSFGKERNPVELSAGIRRKYLEAKYGSPLNYVSLTLMDYEDAGQKNIENMIGTIQVPLSYVEILVDGQHAKKGRPHVVYLATTEGRLVAGASRGASAVNAGGGVRTMILREGMTRSDIIETRGIADAMRIAEFASGKGGTSFLKKEFESSSCHCDFIGVEPFATGRLLFLRYKARTRAAMGMNMITISSTAATLGLIRRMRKTGVWCRLASESGNLDSDKKPAMVNVIRGRGISVVAEAVIPKATVKRILNTSPKRIVDINYMKNYVGSGLAGSLSHNAHIANALAATFMAYGQDVAQIVDGVTSFDDACLTENGDLYFSVYLPALEVGTYGGGTRRETSKELLKSSGVYGEGDEKGTTKLKLAELIASVCLAAELNLLAAEAEGELASAHSSLKRG